jgi:signal transduction histidine kinase
LTLTTRLSLYFLGALAAVLAGISGGLYALADIHMHRQVDERLAAALRTLVASVEIHPDHVEWEPEQRTLGFGTGRLGDQVYWLMRDNQGRVVDHSPQPDAEELLTEAMATLETSRRPTRQLDWHGQRWLVTQHWLRPEAAAGPPTPRQPADDKGAGSYPALAVTVGVPLEPVRATLRTLAAVLVGLSLTVFLLALAAGRAVCRRALAPVARMAAAARSMSAADRGARLPVAPSGDELTDLGQSFNGLLDRLEESFERQRRFTGEASHQLRTPLASLLGQVEVALRRDRPPEEYRRVLGTVRSQTTHLGRVVEALLFLARSDADARPPDLERMDLSAWLPAHLRSWADHSRATDLRMEPWAGGPAWVKAQPALLGELVNNLIDNACKYSRPGTPVRLRLGRDAGAVCLAVADEGCGIGPDDLPHLFRPFFRSEQARRLGVAGAGLGLAVAARLASAFGGRIALDNTAGKGSCFRVDLPAA